MLHICKRYGLKAVVWSFFASPVVFKRLARSDPL